MPAFRLVAVDATADAFTRHLDAPLVGRVREQQRLRADFEDVVVGARVPHVHAAGPGGRRQVAAGEEFLADAGETADVLRGRCLHYGEDITYWPLVEILLAIGVEPRRGDRHLAGRHAARLPQAARGPGGRSGRRSSCSTTSSGPSPSSSI